MRQPDPKNNEVRALEYNAKEGARAVIVYWMTRRVVWPLLLLLLTTITASFVNNGPVAGIVSLLVFTLPIVLVAVIWTGQLRKVWSYWAD